VTGERFGIGMWNMMEVRVGRGGARGVYREGYFGFDSDSRGGGGEGRLLDAVRLEEDVEGTGVETLSGIG